MKKILPLILCFLYAWNLSSSCEDPLYLYCGEITNFSSASSTDVIDFHLDCTENSYSGNEVVFEFNRFTSGMDNWISLWNRNNTNLDFFVYYDICPSDGEGAICIGSSRNDVENCSGGFLNYENFLLDAFQPAGTYYIIVDHSGPDQSYSDINISVSCEGNNCNDAQPIGCELKNGNNSGYPNSAAHYYGCYDNSGCFHPGNTPNSDNQGFAGAFTGGEEVWEFVPESAGIYIIQMQPFGGLDLELFVLSSCCAGEVFDDIFIITDTESCYGTSNCEKASTAGPGQLETIVLEVFPEDVGNSFFLVVDGFLGDAGDYTIEVICDNLDCSNADIFGCGEVIWGDNFSGDNDAENYACFPSSDMLGNEVIYQVNTGFYNRVSFLMEGTSSDLDMFLLDGCSTSECIATSDSQNPFDIDIIENQLLTSGGPYYLVIDGNTPVGSPYSVNMNCGPDCLSLRELLCGTDHFTTDPGQVGVTQSLSFYNDLTSPFPNQYLSNYFGPEVIYEFVAPKNGDYTFILEHPNQLDMDVLIALECAGESNIFNVIAKSETTPQNGVKTTTVALNEGQPYAVIVDTRSEGPIVDPFGDYSLTVSGCETSYCELVVPYPEDDEDYVPYVLFDDDLLPNGADSFTVHYPLDTTGMGGYQIEQTIFPTEDGSLEYICPLPGCYYICFWYEGEDGELYSCCIKYCAEFPNYNCENEPYLNVVSENEETGITECWFSCGFYEEPVDEISDSAYVHITGMGIDTTLELGDEYTIALEYGQYEVCCWEYDPVCEYWRICCKTICLPYVDPAESCGGGFGLQNDGSNDNVYTFSPANTGLSYSITPASGWTDDCTMTDPSSNCTFTFHDPGVYRVCYYDYFSGDPNCCEYICIDEDSGEEEECFAIEYKSDTSVQLTCYDDNVMYWHWIALCSDDPTVICDNGFLEGNGVCWDIPQYQEETFFQICKYYSGCCDQTEVCCDTICYTPFYPYIPNGEEGEEFNECDNISILGFDIDDDGNITGNFSYSGPGVEEEGSFWEIYTYDATTPPNGFKMDKKGSNKMILNTQDEIGGDDFNFDPGDEYFICYSYVDEDGCREYCCIKVQIPTSCDDYTPAYDGEEGSLDFTYTIDNALSGQVVDWFVSEGGIISGTGDEIDIQYMGDGMYYVCCLIYDPVTKCYKLCCKKFCIEDPLECGIEIVPLPILDSSAWDLDPTHIYGDDAMWAIDLPAEYSGMIDPNDVHFFEPSLYGIPPNTKITVSVKYTDSDGCTRICCKMFCTAGPGNCDPECYNNCCQDEDNTWLQPIIDDISTACENIDLVNGIIYQSGGSDGCFYYVQHPKSIFSLSYTIDKYDCEGNLIEQMTTDLISFLEAYEVVWNCQHGLHEECEDPCPSATTVGCELFSSYTAGTPISNVPGWTVEQNMPCTIQQDGTNSYLSITRVNNNGCNGTYSINTLGSQNSDIIEFSYRLWIADNSGIQTQILGDDPNAEFIGLNFLEENDSTKINFQVTDQYQTGDNNSPFEYLPYPQDEWFEMRIILDRNSTDIWIYTAGMLVTHTPQSGMNDFNQIFVNDALTPNGTEARLDDFCLGHCDGCDDDFHWDPGTFEPCSDLIIAQVAGVTETSAVVDVDYMGVEDGFGYDIYEIIDGQAILQGSDDNGSWTCGVDRDYIFCFKYYDPQGCIQYCCIKVRIPSFCGTIEPNYVGEDALDYTYTYQEEGDVVAWFVDNQSYGSGLTSNVVTYDVGGTYFVCCLIYNPILKCYELCCKKVCIIDPLDCGEDIHVEQNPDGTFDLSLSGANNMVLKWQIDIPVALQGTVISPEAFDPSDYGILPGTKITVSVKYIDADGCIKVCCKMFCSSDPGDCEEIPDPCPHPSDIGCETFEDYQAGDPVTDVLGWTSDQNLPCTIQENNSNLYLSIMRENGVGCNATYDISTLGTQIDGLIELSYRLWIEDNSGIQTQIYGDDPNTEYIGMNFLEENDSTKINFQVTDKYQTGDNNSPFEYLPYPQDEWFEMRIVLNQNTGDIWIYVAGILVTYTEDSGMNSLNEFFVDDALTPEPSEARLDDMCLKSCEDCEPTPPDCNLFVVTPNQFNGEWVFDFDDENPTSMAQATTITEPDGTQIAQSGLSNMHSGSQDGTYIFCREYQDDCFFTYMCCDTLCVVPGLECNPITATFSDNTTVVFSQTTTGGVSYVWDFGDGSTLEDDSESVSHMYPNIPANYTATLTVTDACGEMCVEMLDVTIIVDTDEFTVVPEVEDPSCIDHMDGSINLIILGGTEPYTIDWQTGPDGQSMIDNLSAGSFAVTVTESGGEQINLTIVLEAPDTPELTQEITQPTCNSENGMISVSINNGVIVSQYTLSSNGTQLDANTSGVFADLAPGEYDLDLIYGSECHFQTSFNIDASTVPELIVEAVNSGCESSDGRVSISAVDGTPIVSILDDATGIVYQGSMVSNLAAGDYLFIVTDENGCTQAVFESIEGASSLIIDLGVDQILCSDANLTLSTGIDSSAATHEWYLDDELNSTEGEIIPTQPGTYSVIVVDSNGCIASDTVVIQYFPSLINIDGASGSFVLGEEVTFTVSGAEEISWSSDQFALPCSDCEEFTLGLVADGTIMVTATDINECTATDIFALSVTGELVFPNYMTPNGDNSNDQLIISGAEQFEMKKLVVFNKFGQVVFEAESYDNNWGGTDQSGNQLPDGAYYYVLEYQIGEVKFKKVSDLTILKNQ